MTTRNEAQHQSLCREIGQLNEVADVLMRPPGFGQDLYLISDRQASPGETEEFGNLYKYYEGLHKSGQSREQSEA